MDAADPQGKKRKHCDATQCLADTIEWGGGR